MEENQSYYQRNREKIRAKQAEYYKRNQERLKEKSRDYYEANREEVQARNKDYYEENKQRISHRTKEYVAKNADSIKDRQRRYYEKNKAEFAVKGKEYRDKNRKKVSDRKAADRFGVPVEEIQRLRSITHCEICGVELQHYTTNLTAIDHCHEHGHIRGMLCSNCNLLLGHAKDDVAILRNAVDYLEERRLP